MNTENSQREFTFWFLGGLTKHITKNELSAAGLWIVSKDILWIGWQAAGPVSIPQGWALVPKEPTAEMIRSADVCVPKTPSAQWRAMVTSAVREAAELKAKP